MPLLFYLIKTSRPPFWLGTISFYLAGSMPADFNNFSFWLGLFFCTFPAGLIINGLNDIADRESDLINPRKQGQIMDNKQRALIIHISLIFVVIFVLLFFFLQNYFAVLTVFLIVGLWSAYSLKPLRLKSRPFLDSISNGIGMLLFFVLGKSLAVERLEEYVEIPHVALALFGGIVAVHALQTLWDYDVDKKTGDKTIGGLLQVKGTLLFCLIIYFGILLLFKPINIAVALYLLLSIILCVLMFRRPSKEKFYYSTWIILYGFPILFFYLVIFDRTYLLSLLAP